MAVEKEGFATRWSRRKQEVANEMVVEEAPELLDPIIDEETLAEQRLEKLNALTDEDMPDIGTLNEDSDFSGFMSTGVSEALRQMALKKLFHGKSYNVRDGLDEYDGDYSSFEKLDPSVITCDMKHLIEVEAEKLLAAQEKEKRLEYVASEDAVESNADSTPEDVAVLKPDDSNHMELETKQRDINEVEELVTQNIDCKAEGGNT